MERTNDRQWLRDVFENGEGILRLAPTWVPRSFMIPGRRLRLSPQDLYCLGLQRGGINERWFSSTIPADNGPGTPADEGLSYIVWNGKRMSLREAVASEGEKFLGEKIFNQYGGWRVYAKFFDNQGPIPHHLHQMAKHAANVRREGKPEAYYFPPEMNSCEGNFPFTFFGLLPGTTKAQVCRCLERWEEGDNEILNLSQAYRLERDTGWLLPPGILHAPGSLCTFEVQWASDVFAFYQNMVEGRVCSRDLLVKDVPEEHWNDFDYLVDMIDWEANVDPDFYQHHHLRPVTARGSEQEGFIEKWVIYGYFEEQDLFSAKTLIVFPGCSCTLQEDGAYGVYVTQGRGTVGSLPVCASSMIRYGQMAEDELFVTFHAAVRGVSVHNTGSLPLMLLKFFGPGSSSGMPAPWSSGIMK